MRGAVPFEPEVFGVGVVGLPLEEGIEQEAAGAAGGIEDGLAQLGIEELHHEADDVPRGAELAVLAGLFYFFEQILEDVAHDVGVDAAGIERAEVNTQL